MTAERLKPHAFRGSGGEASGAVPGGGAGLAAKPGWLLGDGAPASPRLRKLALAAIAACTLIALALRLYNIDGRPLWVDEAGTLGFASLDASTLVNTMGKVELTPPGYYLLMGEWLELGDGSEFWLRLPSALVSTAAVPLFAAFLWLAAGPVAAAWGAALLAVAGAHMRYGQEARVYAAVFTLFVLGLLCMERLVDALVNKRSAGRRWGLAAALSVVTAVSINLHFSAVFAAATVYVYGLVLLVARGALTTRRFAALFASGLAGLALAAPVLWLAYAIASDTRGSAYWMPTPDLAQAFLEFQTVLFAPHLDRLAPIGTLFSLAALGACLWAGWRDPHVRALAAGFAFAAVGFYAVSHVTPILMGRTVFFTLAITLAVVAYGLSRIGRPWLVAAVAAAAFLPQVKGTLNQATSTSFYGEAWDGVAAAVAKQAAPRDTIMTIGAFETVALDYYLAREGPLRSGAAVGDKEGGVNTLSISTMTGATPVNVVDLDGPVCEALRPGADIWLISRDAKTYGEYVGKAASGLRASGSTMQARALHGSLFVERWSPPAKCG